MKIIPFSRGRNRKRSWLAVLGILAMLVGLLFSPGTGHAQTSASGTVAAWGSNLEGQTNVPAGLSGVTAISVGNKHNLALLSDAVALAGLGATSAVIDQLLRTVPGTRSVGSDENHWWRERKSWFFKPGSGFGSRGAYRGDKLTRRVFTEVMAGDYVAQALTPPSERWRTTAEGRQAYKVDLRCYAYRGRVLFMAARLYQGQKR